MRGRTPTKPLGAAWPDGLPGTAVEAVTPHGHPSGRVSTGHPPDRTEESHSGSVTRSRRPAPVTKIPLSSSSTGQTKAFPPRGGVAKPGDRVTGIAASPATSAGTRQGAARDGGAALHSPERTEHHMLARIRKAMDENESGFTLIELLVVMIIIGILAAIAIPVFLNQRKNAVDASVKSDLRTIANELESYYTDNEVYPAAVDPDRRPGGTAVGWPATQDPVSQNTSLTFDLQRATRRPPRRTASWPTPVARARTTGSTSATWVACSCLSSRPARPATPALRPDPSNNATEGPGRKAPRPFAVADRWGGAGSPLAVPGGERQHRVSGRPGSTYTRSGRHAEIRHADSLREEVSAMDKNCISRRTRTAASRSSSFSSS